MENYADMLKVSFEKKKCLVSILYVNANMHVCAVFPVKLD